MNGDPWMIGAAALALTVAGIVATWAVRISKGETAADAAKKAQETADKAREELSDYKIHVAETYVSHNALSELERRLNEAIKGVGDRLERLFHPAPPSV
jgi:hypothetical protein